MSGTGGEGSAWHEGGMREGRDGGSSGGAGELEGLGELGEGGDEITHGRNILESLIGVHETGGEWKR